ncbi:hypothetical protein V6N11_081230 [Hibiscus sabdariffa]|uniref:Reverse transcriptase zinc-binding domain-containing protein n=1 Tax=Hibiscus sabdariffa TaxID=183260 RepID=A0ABR2QJQ6_9ROSI
MATTNGSMEKDIWRLVWSKLAPPKVEAFLWKTIKGRLPVGTELLKHNINVPWSGKCILCSREAETVSHLLCHCHVASKVWQKWCEVWNICLVMPGDLSGFLRWWNSKPTFPSLKVVWKMIFYETIWTIWRCRNEALFNAKYCNEFRSIFGVAVSGIFKSCKGCVQASFRMPLSSEMWKLYCQKYGLWVIGIENDDFGRVLVEL